MERMKRDLEEEMVHGRYLQAIINQLPVAINKRMRGPIILPSFIVPARGLESISLHHEDVDGLLSSGTTIF